MILQNIFSEKLVALFVRNKVFPAYLGVMFCLGVYPIVYTEMYFWARIGDSRLVLVGIILMLYLFVQLSPILLRWVALVAAFYLFSSIFFSATLGNLSRIGATQALELISVAVLFMSGLALRKSADRKGCLGVTILIFALAGVVFINSISYDIVIFGLNHRRDVDSFNYLLPAISLLGLFYFNSLRADFKYSLAENLPLLVVVLIGIYCSGSRLVLFVFIFSVVFNFAHDYLKEGARRFEILLCGSVLLACLVLLYGLSSPSVFNRYNPVGMFNDASFVERIVTVKSDFGERNKDTVSDDSGQNGHVFDEPVLLFDRQELIGLGNVLFGLKMISPEAVRLVGYNHTFYEFYKNYGVVFFVMFFLFALNVILKYGFEKRSMPIVFCLLLSLFFHADIFILWWLFLGLAAGSPRKTSAYLRRFKIIS